MSAAAGFELPARHDWPVVLHYGALVLRPMRWRDAAPLRALRERNRSWTGPWDATSPAGLGSPAMSASRLVRLQRQNGREASQLSWLLAWDQEESGAAGAPAQAPAIGQLSVAGISYGSARSGTIGYWIDKGFAGHGLMPIAVAMASDYCFQVLRLHRLEICLRPENRPSRRVAEKVGFAFEGTRPRYLHIDGDWRDHSVYVMTDETRPEGGVVWALTHGVAPHALLGGGLASAPGSQEDESDSNV
ncbi:ribosomal-protein-alanine N-acetyltransferase [Propionibacterium cyclohexanicum]|uniref:Ribosomal-protein-alanine N-acetyltransferase n=1 Tax=Propionibacterium cyclohexanicum TaxID=64702 RepID=A0A1H9U3M6_9ACTN|nr:GNAT family protein [Propionibacterium cyclohexanicum]SES04105.1 ribosomal-protein-alanine N-acetyltransferase [Propionibacterium cyclohexanicum]